jgi:hypothetical protein
VHEARRRRRAGETGRIDPGLAREVAPTETAARHPLATHDAAPETRDDRDDRAEGPVDDERNGGMP